MGGRGAAWWRRRTPVAPLLHPCCTPLERRAEEAPWGVEASCHSATSQVASPGRGEQARADAHRLGGRCGELRHCEGGAVSELMPPVRPPAGHADAVQPKVAVRQRAPKRAAPVERLARASGDKNHHHHHMGPC